MLTRVDSKSQIRAAAVDGRAQAVWEFRVTKYDPNHRDRRGAYTRDEWTSVSDIGQAFAEGVLTEAAYRQVEDAYASIAVAFLQESGIVSLRVAGLENHAAVVLPFADGADLTLADVETVVRRLLCGEFWCRLEGVGVGAFVHVGYDYYMYIGVPMECPAAMALARERGLFPEPFLSPYRGSPN